MQIPCTYADPMKTLQVRNVPDDVHRRLKARAALSGQSISEYLLAQVRRDLERPTREELEARVRARTRVPSELGGAELVRRERDGR